MTWRRARLLPVILALWSCAEGGTRGSGISTSVLGNVASVQSSSSDAVAGILVVIDGTEVEDTTGADGIFSLAGSFEGRVTLVFELPDGGGQAQTALNVPAGGILTLNDVLVDANRGEAIAATQDVDFEGVVVAIDCVAGALSLNSLHHAPDDVDLYIVRLGTSSLQDVHGTPVSCTAVRVGEQASVQGTVDPDGSFGHATIVLQN